MAVHLDDQEAVAEHAICDGIELGLRLFRQVRPVEIEQHVAPVDLFGQVGLPRRIGHLGGVTLHKPRTSFWAGDRLDADVIDKQVGPVV